MPVYLKILFISIFLWVLYAVLSMGAELDRIKEDNKKIKEITVVRQKGNNESDTIQIRTIINPTYKIEAISGIDNDSIKNYVLLNQNNEIICLLNYPSEIIDQK